MCTLIMWENFGGLCINVFSIIRSLKWSLAKGTATQICYAFLISHIQALITMNDSIIIYKRRREGDYVGGHSKVTY